MLGCLLAHIVVRADQSGNLRESLRLHVCNTTHHLHSRGEASVGRTVARKHSEGIVTRACCHQSVRMAGGRNNGVVGVSGALAFARLLYAMLPLSVHGFTPSGDRVTTFATFGNMQTKELIKAWKPRPLAVSEGSCLLPSQESNLQRCAHHFAECAMRPRASCAPAALRESHVPSGAQC